MRKDNLNVIYLGYSGFPYGFAELQRIFLISKAIVYEGASVIVIGSRGVHNEKHHPYLRKIGHSDKIIYIYSSRTPFRSLSFFKRNLIKPVEKLLEFIVVYALKKKDKIDVAIISTMNFNHLLLYKIFSLVFGFKILLNFTEYNSAMDGRKKIKHKIKDYFWDRFAVRLSDGVFVISEFLINIIKKTDPNKSYLKIPILVDLDRYTGIERSAMEKYFLFCGSAGYKEIIFFIIKSFELINNPNIFLYLIINGNKEQLAEIEKRITDSSKSNLIKTFNGVSDKKLSFFYKNAIGLLIPLRPTIQDEARFPHKIGEYLASGNPLITTNYGEVKYYLKDKVNALVAEIYDEQAFAEKMSYVILNPNKSVIIGENGKKVAIEFADYKKYGERIINFIKEL